MFEEHEPDFDAVLICEPGRRNNVFQTLLRGVTDLTPSTIKLVV